MFRWTVAWTGFYLLLVQVSWPEIVAALACAGLAAWLQRAAARAGFAPVRLPWRRLVPFWRMPWAVLTETWGLSLALFSPGPPQGTFLEASYQPEANPDEDLGGRALLAFGVCFSPNSYAVDIHASKAAVRIRQLLGRRLAPSDRAFLEPR